MDERDDRDELAHRFEESRGHLLGVAYRMLGSLAEAEDAVQESWLRASRADTSDVVNLPGWLTTVVARICLDALRARESRREDPLPERLELDEPALPHQHGDPEAEAELADSVGEALLVVLGTLPPAERLAFVLHDLFALPFDEIAPIVGRSTAATRQLASRGRRRVQGAPEVPGTDARRQRDVVEAFLAASRNGEFDALLALLDPDVVVRADAVTVRLGAAAEVRGPAAVASTFSGRAQGAGLALVDGSAGAVWSVAGTPRVVFAFTVRDGRVVEIEMLSDPEVLGSLELRPLSD